MKCCCLVSLLNQKSFVFVLKNEKRCCSQFMSISNVAASVVCFIYSPMYRQMPLSNNTGFRSIINVNIFWQENRTHFHCLSKYVLYLGEGAKSCEAVLKV